MDDQLATRGKLRETSDGREEWRERGEVKRERERERGGQEREGEREGRPRERGGERG